MICLTSLIASFGVMHGAQFTVSKSGGQKLLENIKLSNDTRIVVSGTLSADEFSLFQKLPMSVVDLDLRNLTLDTNILPAYAFMGTSLKNVVLPADIKCIGEGAFAQTPVQSVECPSGLEQFGDYAFYNCSALESVSGGEATLSSIGRGAFAGCIKLNYIIPSTVRKVGADAFRKSSIVNADFMAPCHIGSYAFAETPFLQSVSLPDGSMVEEGSFFGSSSLREITMVNPSLPLTYAGTKVLDGEVRVAGETVAQGAFAGVTTAEIIFAPGVRQIEKDAFRNVQGLALVDVRALEGEIPTLSPEAFAGVDVSKIALSVSAEYLNEWMHAPVWSEFQIKGVSVKIEDSANTDGIVIRMDNDNVMISSAHAIDSVVIYGIDGTELSSANLGGVSNEYSIKAPNGVFVVVVKSSGRTRFVKLQNVN